MPIELRCSRDLALRLGANAPGTIAEHKELLRMPQTYLLVRDKATGWPLFWQWALSSSDRATARSS